MFIIGQRLNLAGNIPLRESIKASQADAIQKEAVVQEQAGVQALDIHISDIHQDRPRFMAHVVDQVRCVSRLPLSIDDSDLNVVEAGLARAGKNSFINSPVDVEISERIRSLALKFQDSQLLIVPLKQNKAPNDRHTFHETSQRILSTLEDRGILRNRIMIDAILPCLKQAREKVLETLDRIKMLKEEIGIRSIVGLSNLSYQLKEKEKIHAYFLKLAKGAGLDAVICDPLEKTVMATANGTPSPFPFPLTGREGKGEGERKEFLRFVESIIY